jgi:hypothetical protein
MMCRRNQPFNRLKIAARRVVDGRLDTSPETDITYPEKNDKRQRQNGKI